MNMGSQRERNVAAEQRFADVFSHLGLITAYAQRRGVPDPDDIAADVMTIAWRRLTHVPVDDPRPWLIATARNLLLADRRRRGKPVADLDSFEPAAPAELPAPAV